MHEELDRLRLRVDGELELDLEGEVGGDALALPDADVLLDDALHALDVQVGRLDDVVDAEGRRDAHSPADLGRVLGLLLGHVRRGGDVAGEGDPRAGGAEKARGAGRRPEAAAAGGGGGRGREAAEEEDRGGGGGGRRHGRGGRCHWRRATGMWGACGGAGRRVEQVVGAWERSRIGAGQREVEEPTSAATASAC